MLPKEGGDFVVITKSMKDCMLFHEYNIPAIAPCSENLFLTDLVVSNVKEKFPDIEIYIWTGFLYEQLTHSKDNHLKNILSKSHCIIDGPFIEKERDVTIPMCGSRNQRVIYLDKGKNI